MKKLYLIVMLALCITSISAAPNQDKFYAESKMGTVSGNYALITGFLANAFAPSSAIKTFGLNVAGFGSSLYVYDYLNRSLAEGWYPKFNIKHGALTFRFKTTTPTISTFPIKFPIILYAAGSVIGLFTQKAVTLVWTAVKAGIVK